MDFQETTEIPLHLELYAKALKLYRHIPEMGFFYLSGIC